MNVLNITDDFVSFANSLKLLDDEVKIININIKLYIYQSVALYYFYLGLTTRITLNPLLTNKKMVNFPYLIHPFGCFITSESGKSVSSAKLLLNIVNGFEQM